MRPLTTAIAALVIATGIGVGAQAHGPEGQDSQSMGPGMMGPGMMGPGMGYGMMGPGMGYGMGYDMMGPGMGYGMMGPGMRGRGMGYGMMAPLAKDLSADDVKHMLGHRLAWQHNPNLKLGKIEEKDADTIVAEIVTKDGSLVRRYEVDRHTGWMRPVG